MKTKEVVYLFINFIKCFKKRGRYHYSDYADFKDNCIDMNLINGKQWFSLRCYKCNAGKNKVSLSDKGKKYTNRCCRCREVEICTVNILSSIV